MPNRPRDVTGQEFGHLTAIKLTRGRTRYGAVWLVQCRCGKKLKMVLSDLVKKPKHSKQMPRTCGCFRKRNRGPKYKGVGDLSHTRWKNIAQKAVRRGHLVTITMKHVWALFLAQDRRCALTGVPLRLDPVRMTAGATTASLDRIDSTKGYIRGNVQWVHRDINFMKQALSEDVFVEWCRRVAAHARGKR